MLQPAGRARNSWHSLCHTADVLDQHRYHNFYLLLLRETIYSFRFFRYPLPATQRYERNLKMIKYDLKVESSSGPQSFYNSIGEEKWFRALSNETVETYDVIKKNYEIVVISGTSNDFSLTINLADSEIRGTIDKNLYYNILKVSAIGDDRSNSFYGGYKNDLFSGKKGNDQYYINNEGDKIVELKDGGRDVVIAKTSYELPSNVEDAKIFALGYAKIEGNSSNNVITDNDIWSTEIHGMAGNDTIKAGVAKEGQNALFGGIGNDMLVGGASGGKEHLDYFDYLFGEAGNDTLRAGTGTESLWGGSGRDTLIGTKDAHERYVFDTAPSSKNVDRIADFTNGASTNDDEIWLSKAIFKNVTFDIFDSSMSFNNFKEIGRGGGKVDSSDRILYNSDTGQLFYDANGSAAGGRALFAVLIDHEKLDYHNFHLF